MYYCHLILILQLYFDYRCISNTKVINGLILTLDICDYFTLNVFEKYSPLLSDHNLTITMLLGCNVKCYLTPSGLLFWMLIYSLLTYCLLTTTMAGYRIISLSIHMS